MLWQKGTTIQDWVTRFTVGEDYHWDTLLLPYDIEGTRAQAWALAEIKILTQDELSRIEAALDRLANEVQEGKVKVKPEDEDCHTVIEEYLTKELGETGKRIHTGRSRNDQVLVALRLFLREQIRSVAKQCIELTRALIAIGRNYDDVLMPGYTHLQRAMPTTPGLWAMGYAELLADDLEVLRHAFDRINVSPLGSAAGYGVPYLDLPRSETAKRLGFRDVQTHVTAVQLSRGKLELSVVHALVQVAATINRLAADLVLFNTAEFSFVELPAEFCTGSSIMPQKQNPDVLELARATYHRITSEMNLLVTLPANLPSGYHRDLQLTKEAVMRATLLVQDLLTAMINLMPGVRFRRERLREATTPELFATAAALQKVIEGMPFREAYREAAKALESLETPDDASALSDYVVPGYPGHVVPELIEEWIASHLDWTGSHQD